MTTQTHAFPLGSTGARTSQARWTSAALWALQIAAAAMFLVAGIGKLAGTAPMVQLFAAIGVGQWFRYVTGAIEIVGAVLVLVPSLAVAGAFALAATMVGAIVTHLFILGNSPAIPIVLLAITATIVWGRGRTR